MDALKGLLPPTHIGTESLRTARIEKVVQGVKQGAQNQEALKAATEFEGLLLKQMLDSMWSTVPKDSLLGGSQEEKMYRDFYTDSVAKDISEKQSLGIKDVIYRELTKK